jgi:hypothetical protein
MQKDSRRARRRSRSCTSAREELFKALKSGCQIGKRQMESYEALRIALALFLPIALTLFFDKGSSA